MHCVSHLNQIVDTCGKEFLADWKALGISQRVSETGNFEVNRFLNMLLSDIKKKPNRIPAGSLCFISLFMYSPNKYQYDSTEKSTGCLKKSSYLLT